MAADSVVVALRLVGGRAFSGGLASASKQVQSFERSAQTASVGGDKLSKSGGKMGRTLGMVAPAAGGVAAALGAGATAAAFFGLKFNASMEQSTVAFSNLLGSEKKAKGMLDRLYKLSAKTPFEFPQLTQASQKLLGFGMASKDILPTMTAIGDAVAGAGGGGAEIESVSRALGQMQAKQKVSSEELLQLAEAGVPAFKLLADQLGLTGAQLDKKLRAGAISADKGIPALVAGINKKFGGMATAQSKTFSGMLSNMKDNAMQILGEATMPLFEGLRDKVFPAITELMASGKLQKGVKVGMDAIGDAIKVVTPYVLDFINALKPLEPFISNIILPILKGMAGGLLVSLGAALKVVIPLIRIVATVLGWVGQKARPLRGTFVKLGAIVGLMVSPLGALATAFKALGPVFRSVGNIAKDVGRWIVNAFNNVVGFCKKLPGRIGGALGGMWDGIKTAFRSAINWVINAWNGLEFRIPGFDPPGPGPKFGGASIGTPDVSPLAKGGIMRRAGMALVGERGPELLSLPRGSAVAPLPGGRIEVPVYLNGRQIALAVADETATRRARR